MANKKLYFALFYFSLIISFFTFQSCNYNYTKYQGNSQGVGLKIGPSNLHKGRGTQGNQESKIEVFQKCKKRIAKMKKRIKKIEKTINKESYTGPYEYTFEKRITKLLKDIKKLHLENITEIRKIYDIPTIEMVEQKLEIIIRNNNKIKKHLQAINKEIANMHDFRLLNLEPQNQN